MSDNVLYLVNYRSLSLPGVCEQADFYANADGHIHLILGITESHQSGFLYPVLVNGVAVHVDVLLNKDGGEYFEVSHRNVQLGAYVSDFRVSKLSWHTYMDNSDPREELASLRAEFTEFRDGNFGGIVKRLRELEERVASLMSSEETGD